MVVVRAGGEIRNPVVLSLERGGGLGFAAKDSSMAFVVMKDTMLTMTKMRMYCVGENMKGL